METWLLLLFTRATQQCLSWVFAIDRWLAGWLDVRHTTVLCLKAKAILKLPRPSGSPIIPFFSDPCADTKFREKPRQRWRKIHRVGIFAIFDLSLFISKTVRDGPMVTIRNVRKLWVPDRMVSFSMTFSGP